MTGRPELVMTPRTLNRDEWNEFCNAYRGPVVKDVEVRARIAHYYGTLEFNAEHLSNEVDVYAHEDATDIRISQVQLLVGRNRAALVVLHTPYPVSKWTVLWEGKLFEDET